MSIIDEALKKTQRALSEKEKKIKAQTAVPIISRAQQKSSESIMQPVELTELSGNAKSIKSNKYIYVTGLFFGFILLLLILKNIDSSIFPNAMNKKQIITPAVSTLVLNGTMRIGNHRAALINHNLYQLGQMINGYQIIDIRFNEVDLINPVTHQAQKLTESLNS